MQPILRINNHDYTEYVEELSPSRNDLDAEGSGRDVQSGEMFRIRIASKQKWDVKMLRLPEAVHRQLCEDINPQFFPATILDPETNTPATKIFYVSTVPYGVQRYDRQRQETYYDGTSFSMTER